MLEVDVKPPRLFDGNRAPGFKAQYPVEDMGIVLDTAREYGIPLSSAEEHTKFFQMMIEQGMGELDNLGGGGRDRKTRRGGDPEIHRIA